MAGKQHFYTLRSSRWLGVTILLLSLFAVLGIGHLPWPLPIRVGLSSLVLGWAIHHLVQDALLRKPYSCVAFRLEGVDQIVLVLRNGTHVACRILPDSLVAPYLIILNVAFLERRGRRSVLIWPDAMEADSFRRLRVALRWGAEPHQRGR